MFEPAVSPITVVAAAAQRLAGHMAVLRDAHDLHHVAPGPHDDLTSPEFTAAALLVYRETLSQDYLHRVGVTFLGVADLMDLIAEDHPHRTAQGQWLMMRGYMNAIGTRLAPSAKPTPYGIHVDSPSSSLVGQSTPAIMRFDLLARLTSRAAVLRNLYAADWVSELVVALPEARDGSDLRSSGALSGGWSL